MGNSNSQSFSRFTPILLHGSHPKEGRPTKQGAKFAHPENRVLPISTAGPQCLRSTNNGSILQSGGTLSGRRANGISVTGQKPEFMQLLQKKCHPSSNSTSYQTLYGHRKSHSDPDIVRMMMCENDSEDDEDEDSDERTEGEVNGSKRSIIAVSPSKAKIKSRKKNRAPEPPLSNTLPRSLDRMPSHKENSQRKISFRKKGDGCDTPRRPLPPIPPEELPPPPPPPPPDYNHRETEDRGITKTLSKNYEKNRRVVDKWKLSKTAAEGSIENPHRQRSKSLDRTEYQRREYSGSFRCEEFDRNNSLRNVNIRHSKGSTAVNENKPKSTSDELKEAIAEAARKRAERLDKTKLTTQASYASNFETLNNDIHIEKTKLNLNENIKQYYFADPLSLKYQNNQLNKSNFEYKPNRNNSREVKREETEAKYFGNVFNSHENLSPKRTEFVSEGIKDCIAQKNYKKENSEVKHKNFSDTKQNKWDLIFNEPVRRFLPDGTPSTCSSSEEETEIDLQLRPTLPRKPIELPKFSPTDVWKSINLDFLKSHQQRSDVSSEEGDEVLEDKIHRINRPVAPRRLIIDRSADSGISPDAGSPMLRTDSFDILIANSSSLTVNPNVSVNKEDDKKAWVPQHDLLDDSDTASDRSALRRSEKISKPKGQAKFSMPNLMFPSRSLPRTEQQSEFLETEIIVDKEKSRSRGRRKKSYRNSEGQHFNSLRNLKKVLGMRAKNAIVENKGLDPNWSLSRSLPNFIESENPDELRKNSEYTEHVTADLIRRSNSESRALQQVTTGNKKQKNGDFGSQSKLQRAAHFRSAFVGQTSEGHVIYLPEYSTPVSRQNSQQTDDIHINTDSELVVKKSNGRKKFSYQSTVRQEEKKKLEEKLAKEIEAKERQRQKEIEWMNKVEEEFRKQRDKEKVNIRHQLRILNLQDKATNLSQNSSKNINNQESQNPVRSSDNNLQQNNDQKLGLDLYSHTVADKDVSEYTYNWKPPTGMRKWLKKQNKNSENRCLSSVRPEPEGGRSSSDDCRQLDWKHDLPADQPLFYQSNYTNGIRAKCNHSKDTHCSQCSPGPNISSGAESSEIQKASSSPDALPVRSAIPTSRKLERQKSNKEKHYSSDVTAPLENGISCGNNGLPDETDDCHLISESVKEYELHTRLCRTNSGRTFESHSYYAIERHKGDSEVVEEDKQGIKTLEDCGPRTNLFSTLRFEKELKENVRKKNRDFEKRTRKHQVRDYDTDDSASDEKEKRHQRHAGRNQRKKREGTESREPSFSRNHPLRNGARIKSQMNGHHVIARSGGLPVTSNKNILLPNHRLPSSVVG